MIYFVLFLHDYITARIILNKQVNEYVYLADLTNESQVIEGELEKLLNSKMLICKTKNIKNEIEEGLFYYSGVIIADIEVNTAFNYVKEMIHGSQIDFSITTTSTYIRGKKVVIPIAAIDEISDKVTKISEVKQKYLDQFNNAIKRLIEGENNGD